jgi:hypothetical protein
MGEGFRRRIWWYIKLFFLRKEQNIFLSVKTYKTN